LPPGVFSRVEMVNNVLVARFRPGLYWEPYSGPSDPLVGPREERRSKEMEEPRERAEEMSGREKDKER